MTSFFIIIGIILFLAIVTLFTGFLNQIGRALVGSLFTNENIELYFGSFPNDNKERFEIKVSRFKLFFIKNYCWFQGSCRFIDTRFLSIQKKIIVIAATSVAFLLSSSLYYFAAEFELHRSIQISSILFFGFSCINIFNALLSKGNFIEDTIGTTLDNYMYEDEKTIEVDEGATEILHLGFSYYNKGEFEKAIPLLERAFNNSSKNSLVALVLFECYLITKKYKEAEKFIDFAEECTQVVADHYCKFGWTKSQLEKYQEGIYYYNKALELDNKNALTLNNRGYTYNLLERYEEAILDFDVAISIEPNAAYPHNNRGLAKIKLGKTEEGLKDIQTSMELDDTNSYAYRNLGIYYFDRKEYKIALENFEKSYQLDKETHLIEENINETKAILKKLEEN